MPNFGYPFSGMMNPMTGGIGPLTGSANIPANGVSMPNLNTYPSPNWLNPGAIGTTNTINNTPYMGGTPAGSPVNPLFQMFNLPSLNRVGNDPRFNAQYGTAAGINATVSGMGLALPGYVPYTQVGTEALAGGPFSLFNDPGYKFMLQQGQQGITNQEASQGNYFSPSTSQALSQYNQGLASQDYQNAFANWMNQIGVGQNAQNSLAQLISTGAGNIAGLYSGHGQQMLNFDPLNTATFGAQFGGVLTNALANAAGSYFSKKG